MIEKDHLVITVHGIRTFGQWQEKLETLVESSNTGKINFVKIDYGYFSVIAFFLPFVRWFATKRIKRLLFGAITEQPWRRVDIVAHSFGTHLVACQDYQPVRCAPFRDNLEVLHNRPLRVVLIFFGTR